MSEGSTGVQLEKREYPRVKASCPIRYQIDDNNAWEEATLLDYSATGIRMRCDDLILKGTKLKIELLPGSLQKIPQISAEGVVVRFSMDDECNFQIGCEFVSVVRSLIQNAQSNDYISSV